MIYVSAISVKLFEVFFSISPEFGHLRSELLDYKIPNIRYSRFTADSEHTKLRVIYFESGIFEPYSGVGRVR
jgi:hypothetical protein